MLDLKTGTVKKESQQSSARMSMGARRSFICRMRFGLFSNWEPDTPTVDMSRGAELVCALPCVQVWLPSSGAVVHEQTELPEEQK